jgi:hypothetical protein
MYAVVTWLCLPRASPRETFQQVIDQWEKGGACAPFLTSTGFTFSPLIDRLLKGFIPSSLISCFSFLAAEAQEETASGECQLKYCTWRCRNSTHKFYHGLQFQKLQARCSHNLQYLAKPWSNNRVPR